MRQRRRHLCVNTLLSTLLLLLPTASADEVFLASGRSLKGLVVEEHVDLIVLSTPDGEQMLWRKDIDQVFFDDPERNYLYLGNEALAAGDAGTAMALFQKSAHLNPSLEEVRDALRRVGDERRKQSVGWSVPEAALWSRWGLRLSKTASYPVVADLAPDGAAARAGFRAGDQIRFVWGESMGFRPVAEAADRLLGPPGTEVKMTIQREIRVSLSPSWPGFDVGMTEHGLVVTSVGEPGQRAGLQTGDRLVVLDKQPTRYVPLSSAKSAIARARTAGLRCGIQRHLLLIRPS